MITVSAAVRPETPDPENVSITEMLAIIEANRTRTRTLGTMILSVCGTLLSATFVIVFFILKENSASHHLKATFLFFLSASITTCAIFASLVSATLSMPVSSPRKLALLDTATRIYRREVRWVRAAVFLLAGAILAFGAALVAFALRVLASQTSLWPLW
jgi:hypothetical protein